MGDPESSETDEQIVHDEYDVHFRSVVDSVAGLLFITWIAYLAGAY